MSLALFIPLHSFVDLITNSSSELFVAATNNVVKAAYQLVNAFLKLSGSKDTAENLLNIRLVYCIRHYEHTNGEDKEFDTDEERSSFCEANEIDQYDENVKSWEVLKVTPKVKGVDLLHVAKLLENFGLTFEARECQQG